MKQYHIIVDNQPFDVQILDDPRKSEVRVLVDGEELVVRVEVEAPGQPVVASPAPAYPSAPVSRPVVTAAQPVEAAEGSSAFMVKAPLPGVVVSIAVKPGQPVVFNQELLVIEAMKAMNVIRAPRAGKVGIITVTEGRKIAYGAPLLTLE
jgi:biotin carboxyl carrier protein